MKAQWNLYNYKMSCTTSSCSITYTQWTALRQIVAYIGLVCSGRWSNKKTSSTTARKISHKTQSYAIIPCNTYQFIECYQLGRIYTLHSLQQDIVSKIFLWLIHAAPITSSNIHQLGTLYTCHSLFAPATLSIILSNLEPLHIIIHW